MPGILRSLWTALIALPALVATSPASAGTLTTDNGPVSNAFASYLGTQQAYGLLFEAPVTGTLDSVTMATYGGWDVFLPEIFGGVAGWTDGVGNTGTVSSLFHGAITLPMVNVGAQLFTFNPGTAVTAGSRYVVYLSTIRPVPTTGYASVPDTLPGYLGVVNIAGDPTAATGTWERPPFSSEIVTAMTFSYADRIPPVAEPETWALFLVGIGMVGGILRHQRRPPGAAAHATPAG